MNELALVLFEALFVISVVASALTEGTKKILKNRDNLAYNIIDLVFTAIVTLFVWYYMSAKAIIPGGIDSVFCLVVLIAFGYIASTCGYDKIKQIFTQLTTVEK